MKTEELQFSSEALAARFVYYQGYNDLNIIVEDINREFEYETIFKRLLGDKYCIKAIFAVGGKLEVMSYFQEFGEKYDNIPNVYLVDGDFDRYVSPSDMIQSPNYIYLQAYNIEYYLLDEIAVLQYAKGLLHCLDSEVVKRVCYKTWFDKIVEQASKLFFAYCLVKKYLPSTENVSRNHYLFIDAGTGFERLDNPYQSYWKMIESQIPDSQIKLQEIITLYEQMNGKDYSKIICGKFLLTSLSCYLRRVVDRTFRTEDLRWFLLNSFDIEKLDYVRQAILAVA